MHSGQLRSRLTRKSQDRVRFPCNASSFPERSPGPMGGGIGRTSSRPGEKLRTWLSEWSRSSAHNHRFERCFLFDTDVSKETEVNRLWPLTAKNSSSYRKRQHQMQRMWFPWDDDRSLRWVSEVNHLFFAACDQTCQRRARG